MNINQIKKLKIIHYCGEFDPANGIMPKRTELEAWSTNGGVRDPGVTFKCMSCDLSIQVLEEEDDEFIVFDRKKMEAFLEAKKNGIKL